jgi:hypothetical protein
MFIIYLCAKNFTCWFQWFIMLPLSLSSTILRYIVCGTESIVKHDLKKESITLSPSNCRVNKFFVCSFWCNFTFQNVAKKSTFYQHVLPDIISRTYTYSILSGANVAPITQVRPSAISLLPYIGFGCPPMAKLYQVLWSRWTSSKIEMDVRHIHNMVWN